MNQADYIKFHEAVYPQDNPPSDTGGWIQWKGTEVCMDIHCVCGNFGHFDGDFFYTYECPSCHRKYAVGANIKFIPLTDEQAEFCRKEWQDFKTTEIETESEKLDPASKE
jgi:hypothetical protein